MKLKRPKQKGRGLDQLLDDVDHLAAVAVETVQQLDQRGLRELARPLERALVRLGG